MATGTMERTRRRADRPEDHVADGGGGEDTPTPIVLTAEQKSSIRILVVDDEETLCESCVSLLEQEGFRVRGATRGSEAEALLRKGTHDIVLLDLYMSGVQGTELLETALEAREDALVIVMTGRPTVESSIQALRDGAWDYIPKPFAATHLQVLVGRAAHTVIVGRESNRLKAESSGSAGKSSGGVLLGQSPGFLSVMDLAQRVASTDASVFITGESGTGKEIIAKYIHHNSRRSSRQWVALNCAAIPDALLESEMFGHVKGAFTGATRDKQGLMEVASGGTLFLDELTEMSMQTQAKLLRVVQDGVVRRVGSTGTDAVVNVRFIAATNRDPGGAVRDGNLREDLYYRLRVVPIHIPPLRQRADDIPALAEHFLDVYWQRHRGARRAANAERGRAAHAPGPALEGQRARAAERDRARGRARRAGRADRARGHPGVRGWTGRHAADRVRRHRHLDVRVRRLSRGAGARARPLRAGVPRVGAAACGREHVRSGACGRRRSHHAVPADGQARPPQGRAAGRVGARNRPMPGTEALPDTRGVLADAVAHLREACTDSALGAPEPDLLREEISRVADALAARMSGRPDPPMPVEEADRLAILDALRTRTLEAWPDGERDGLLETMRAFEAVRARLSPDGGEGPLPPGILSPYGHRLLREVAHTLRSPLGSVVMLTAMLRDGGGDLDALQRKHLGLVHRASITLASLSNDLLALTGEVEELRARPVPFLVDEVLDAVTGAVEPVAEERGVDFRVEGTAAGTRVGQRGALTRALTSLTLNAALLVREGRLSLTVADEGDEASFEVEVTGAAEAVDEVFEVFPSPPGATDYTLSHRGLGFALARHLVRRMGSEVRVAERAEGGLRFSFRLGLPAAGKARG